MSTNTTQQTVDGWTDPKKKQQESDYEALSRIARLFGAQQRQARSTSEALGMGFRKFVFEPLMTGLMSEIYSKIKERNLENEKKAEPTPSPQDAIYQAKWKNIEQDPLGFYYETQRANVLEPWNSPENWARAAQLAKRNETTPVETPTSSPTSPQKIDYFTEKPEDGWGANSRFNQKPYPSVGEELRQNMPSYDWLNPSSPPEQTYFDMPTSGAGTIRSLLQEAPSLEDRSAAYDAIKANIERNLGGGGAFEDWIVKRLFGDG